MNFLFNLLLSLCLFIVLYYMKTKKNKSNLIKNHKFTKKSCVYHYKQITPQTLLNLFDKKM